MNNSSYWISLDIHDTASQAVLAVKKGDNSREICASLTENGKEYVIADGCSAVFTAKKPDGTKLYNDCVIEDNSVKYVVTNNTTSAVGLTECEFRLLSPEDKLLVCPRFTLIVEDTVVDDDDVMDSSDEFSALSKMVGKVERADEMAQDALDVAEKAVERAESTRGIYVGSGDMPKGYDVQIDPEGEALLLDNAMSDTSENVPKTKVVKAYVDEKVVDACAEMERDTALMHARLDEVIAMRSTTGATVYEFTDTLLSSGTIICNGAAVHIGFTLRGMSAELVEEGSYYETGYIIPPAFTPLTKIYLTDSNAMDNITVTINPEHANEAGWLKIEVTKNSGMSPMNLEGYNGFYDLASIRIDELADIRVGYDGTVYETAGEAVRAQTKDLVRVDPSAGELLLDNAMSDTSENVPKTKVVKAYVDDKAAAVLKKSEAAAQASADAIAQESDEYPGCFYRTVNGVTEWLNPPMAVGTEYRTVERHRGKPVYVQEFAIGALPNATSKSYNTYVGTVDRILSASVAIQEASSGRTFAYASMDVKCYVGEDAGDWMYIVITAPSDSSGNNGFVTVKYTKTTDAVG